MAIDVLTSGFVTVACMLALLAETLIAINRRSIPRLCLATAIAVLFVIYFLASFAIVQPVELRMAVRISIAGVMINLYLIHRHEARDARLMIQARWNAWKRRRFRQS
jgi:hypothetical protein